MPEHARASGRLHGLMAAYPLFTRLVSLGVDRYLASRVRRGKEEADRLPERKGIAERPRPDGPIIWFHGASVGESLSVLPLIERFRAERPECPVLVTTGTVTSARLLAERLPPGAFHQYVPLDHPDYVDRFLKHWRPSLAVWVESEFWPNLITRTAAHGVPLVLVNARMSDKSLKGWSRVPVSIAGLLGQFSECLAQDEETARRLLLLGARRVVSAGNLKLAAPPLPADEAELGHFHRRVWSRPTWLAASTHEEEAVVLEAHRLLAGRFPDLLTIIAPRQPDRGEAVAKLARDGGIAYARRTFGEEPDTDIACYIADTIGEMGLFFRMAPVTFLGRSLVALGGSNPLEPARLDSAILHGPHTDNFRATYRLLQDAGGAQIVQDAESLAEAVGTLLTDDAARRTLSEAAAAVATRSDGVLDSVFATLSTYLPPAPEPPAPQAPELVVR